MGRLAINESMTSHTFPPPLAESYAESLAERANQDIAILISGGLDSAILLGEALKVHPRVHPITLLCGLYWEPIEQDHLARFLKAVASPKLAPLVTLTQPVADLYGHHWSTTGEDIPDAHSPDDAVCLPGRHVFLLAKPMVYCHMKNIPTLAMAPLQSNPFPDATPDFFHNMVAVLNQALKGNVALRLPYLGLRKRQVMRRGRDLPLELTFSCIHPQKSIHCGACNKCAERRQAFAEADLVDPTPYANEVNQCTE